MTRTLEAVAFSTCRLFGREWLYFICTTPLGDFVPQEPFVPLLHIQNTPQNAIIDYGPAVEQ